MSPHIWRRQFVRYRVGGARMDDRVAGRATFNRLAVGRGRRPPTCRRSRAVPMRPILVSTLACLAAASASGAEPRFQFFQPLDPPRSFAGHGPSRPGRRRAGKYAPRDRNVRRRRPRMGRSRRAAHARMASTFCFAKQCWMARPTATGPLSEHTLEELKQLDAGSWFARRFTGLQHADARRMPGAGQRQNQSVSGLPRRSIPSCWCKQIQSAGIERQVLVSRRSRNAAAECAKSPSGTIAVMPDWQLVRRLWHLARRAGSRRGRD